MVAGRSSRPTGRVRLICPRHTAKLRRSHVLARTADSCTDAEAEQNWRWPTSALTASSTLRTVSGPGPDRRARHDPRAHPPDASQSVAPTNPPTARIRCSLGRPQLPRRRRPPSRRQGGVSGRPACSSCCDSFGERGQRRAKGGLLLPAGAHASREVGHFGRGPRRPSPQPLWVGVGPKAQGGTRAKGRGGAGAHSGPAGGTAAGLLSRPGGLGTGRESSASANLASPSFPKPTTQCCCFRNQAGRDDRAALLARCCRRCSEAQARSCHQPQNAPACLPSLGLCRTATRRPLLMRLPTHAGLMAIHGWRSMLLYGLHSMRATSKR